MTHEQAPRRLLYRASNGLDLSFDFVFCPESGWRIYIIDRYDYGRRSTAAAHIHRYTDDCGFYICWDRQIGSFRDAQQVTASWAEATLRYMRTGKFKVPRRAPPIGYYNPRPTRHPVPVAYRWEQRR